MEADWRQNYGRVNKKKTNNNTLSPLDAPKEIKPALYVAVPPFVVIRPRNSCCPWLKALLFITLSVVNLNQFGILVLLRQWCRVKAFFNLSKRGPGETESAHISCWQLRLSFRLAPPPPSPPPPPAQHNPSLPRCNWNCSYFHHCSWLSLQLRLDSTSECKTLYSVNWETSLSMQMEWLPRRRGSRERERERELKTTKGNRKTWGIDSCQFT